MKITLTFLLCAAFFNTFINAQNIGIGTTTPKASALLDVTSNSKGVLMPRLTTAERKEIVNPERGLLVFDTDKGTFMLFDGAKWRFIPLEDEEKSSIANRNAPVPSLNSHFGTVVDISGNYAVIGAPFNNQKRGEAYIFLKDAAGWKVQARLAATDSATFDFYGSAVAIYGDYCIVGASQKMISENYTQGKVYVYRRSGTNWNLDAALTEANGSSGDYFGYSVDITLSSANIPLIAVGVPYTGYIRKGRVITYIRNNTTNTWGSKQTIAPADLADADQFGYCVSMHKDYLVVGAPWQKHTVNNTTALNAGAAYMFVFGGGVFTQQQKFDGFYPDAGLGTSVTIYENKMAMSAPWQSADGFTTGSGAVFLLKRNGATWDYTYSYFTSPDNVDKPATYLRFGQTMSLSNNQLLIGAASGVIFPPGSSIGASTSGSAYLFVTTDDGESYYLKDKIVSTSSAISDLFGHSVSIDPNGNYIIGMPYQHVTTSGGILPEAGGVYFGYYDY